MNQGIDISIPKLSAPVEILHIDRRAYRLLKRASLYTVAEVVLAVHLAGAATWQSPRSVGAICYNQTMKKLTFTIPRAKLAAFCRRWNISELALFGSALRDDFRSDSDIDLLVSFAPGARLTLFDMARMQAELKEIFGRDVDLISKRGLENSRNYLRRKQILDSAQVIHVAR